MYTHEIDELLANNNYNLDAQTYLSLLSSSPQINHVKYSAYGDYFEVWTSDGYYWKFNIKDNE